MKKGRKKNRNEINTNPKIDNLIEENIVILKDMLNEHHKEIGKLIKKLSKIEHGESTKNTDQLFRDFQKRIQLQKLVIDELRKNFKTKITSNTAIENIIKQKD